MMTRTCVQRKHRLTPLHPEVKLVLSELLFPHIASTICVIVIMLMMIASTICVIVIMMMMIASTVFFYHNYDDDDRLNNFCDHNYDDDDRLNNLCDHNYDDDDRLNNFLMMAFQRKIPPWWEYVIYTTFQIANTLQSLKSIQTVFATFVVKKLYTKRLQII